MKIKKIFLNSACSAVLLSIGYLAGRERTKKKITICGNLRIDSYEKDEPPKMFLEIIDGDRLKSSEYVVLNVVREDYISHKF